MRSAVEAAVARVLKRFPDLDTAEQRLLLTDITAEVMLVIPTDTQIMAELEEQLELKEQECQELSQKADELYDEKEALAHEVEILRDGIPGDSPPHLRLVD